MEITLASHKLSQLATGPLMVIGVDSAVALSAMNVADTLGIDLTDAVLLQVTGARGAVELATDDAKLAQSCRQLGITPETPIDVALRQQMAQWENANLPPKGLPRLLRQMHLWLSRNHPVAAQDFWSQTGGGSHLP